MPRKETKTSEEIRADARQRKRNQRARDSALEDQLRLSKLDPAEAQVQEIMAAIAAEDKSTYGPGTPFPDDDPEAINARSEKFDTEKAEGQRKSLETSRFLLFLCVQGIPFSYGPAYFPDGLPLDKKGT